VTTEFTASAPGKLVIAGEYAVLDGLPAISAAVNRRAVATVRLAPVGELRVANTGESFGYTLGPDGSPDWSSDPLEFGAVFTAALRAIAASEPLPADQAPWQLTLDTRDFYIAEAGGATRKLGIGSSAAISVALTAALQSCLGQAPDFALGLAAHRELQRGAGSGIDVATGWYGGVVLMQTAKGAAQPNIERLRWPEGFHIRPVWTGIPAATTQLLQRLDVFRRDSAASYAKLLRQFGEAMRHIRQYWHTGDGDRIAEGLSRYGELLAELDSAAVVGIWSEPHRAFLALARSMGLGYKPSGAGGGDFGLVFSADKASVDAFVHAAHARIVPQTHGVDWAPQGLLLNGRAVAG
jgi:phosphomevalonate kinase